MCNKQLSFTKGAIRVGNEIEEITKRTQKNAIKIFCWTHILLHSFVYLESISISFLCASMRALCAVRCMCVCYIENVFPLMGFFLSRQ